MFDLNGETKQLAIIGWPVEHSYSPQMHNFISEQMGNNYVYTALPVRPDQLGDAVRGMRALDIKGMNVTAPHKYAVMEFLDEIDPEAGRLGSVNTVVNRNGRLTGYNTDAAGFYRSLTGAGIDIEGKDILLLGAGGAAKPVCVYFAERGPRSITIVNRTQRKAEELAFYVEETCDFPIQTKQELSSYDILINTTSVGMHPEEEGCPMEDFSWVNETTAAADMIYNPAETVFLRRARERGAKTVNGLGMLIYQGIIAYELFTGTILPQDMAARIAKGVFGR